MSYKLETIGNFKKEAKRLLKKYPSLRQEIEALGDSLVLNPHTGVSMRDGFYKIRLAIKSKGKVRGAVPEW